MSTTTLSRAFARGVGDEMERDKSIFVIGTDIYVRGGHFAQVKGLGERFGEERVRDAPISEAAMVAAGVGAAMSGMRPVVDLNFADFALGAMDEIVNQAAKMRYMAGLSVPMVIRATYGVALYAAQHNNSLEGFFSQIPGLQVVVPSTPADAYGLIVTALRGQDPVVFLMHKRMAGSRGELPDAPEPVPFGQAAIRRGGGDVTIVGYGVSVGTAMSAADRLAAEGVEAEVIDLRTLYPLDVETVLASVRKTGRLALVTDAPNVGGVAAEVATAVQERAFEYLDAPILRVGAAYTPIPHSPPLIDHVLPHDVDLVEGVKASIAQWPATAASLS
jgi:pyruvate dehydrogenase E1 component beta subunit